MAYVVQVPVQSVEPANTIKEFAGLISGVLNLVVTAIMFFLYDLNKERLAGITEELSRRRDSLGESFIV